MKKGELKYLLFLSVTISLIYFRFILSDRLPYTHDSQNHITRIVHFAAALKEGQWPPRWAGNLNNGYGYPVFNFNYPLANMVSAPLMLFFSAEDAYRMVVMLALTIMGIGIFCLLRSWFIDTHAFLGALLYTTHTYTLALVFVRGGIGELISLALYPWILLLIMKPIWWKTKPMMSTFFLSMLMALFCLAHNVLVLILIPSIFMVWLLSLKKETKNKTIKALGCGMMLSGFFWLPALLEKKWTILEFSPLNNNYLNHFPTILEKLFSPWDWGFSLIGPVDNLPLRLGWFYVGGFGLAGLIMIKQQKISVKLTGLMIYLAVGFYLTLTLSSGLWQKLPLIRYVQFPWRIDTLLLLPSIYLFLWVIVRLKVSRSIVVMMVLLTIYSAVTKARPFDQFSFPDQNYASRTETTTTMDENMPIWFDKNVNYALKDTWFKLTPIAAEMPINSLTVEKWTGSEHRYHLETQIGGTIIEKTAYFPGWEVSIDGKRVSNFPSHGESMGLLSYIVPPGGHQITSSFTERTGPRVLGDVITIVGFLYLIRLLIEGKQHERINK